MEHAVNSTEKGKGTGKNFADEQKSGFKVFSQATATKLSYPSETAELLGLRGFADGTFSNDRINTGRTGFVVDREGRFCRSLLYCYPIPPEGEGKGGSSK